MKEGRLEKLKRQKRRLRVRFIGALIAVLFLSFGLSAWYFSDAFPPKVFGEPVVSGQGKAADPVESPAPDLDEPETIPLADQEEAEQPADPLPNLPTEDPMLEKLKEEPELLLDYQIYRRYLQKEPVELAEKHVYLTFDDGPNPSTTEAILAVLKDQEIPATFFVLGTQVEKYPQLLQSIVEEGHALGNHSYSHVYRVLYSSPEAFMEEMDQTKALIFSLTGIELHHLRAPGGPSGHFTADYYRAIEKAGYVAQEWNVDTKDSGPTPFNLREMKNVVARQSAGKEEVVVLLHDSGHQHTIEALPELIAYFKDLGYVFSRLPEERAVATHLPKALNEIRKSVEKGLAQKEEQ